MTDAEEHAYLKAYNRSSEGSIFCFNPPPFTLEVYSYLYLLYISVASTNKKLTFQGTKNSRLPSFLQK